MGYNSEQSTDCVDVESPSLLDVGRDPTPANLTGDRLFDAIWGAIKGWDISRHNNGLYSGATGNDVMHIHDAVVALAPTQGPLNTLAHDCHAANQHWWHHPATGERLDRNKGELLMLIVSEVAEAMEGERKNLMDDKLPHRKMAEVELADALIRIFDYAGAYKYDLDGAVAEKRAFNAIRPDHKAEARLAADGKKW